MQEMVHSKSGIYLRTYSEGQDVANMFGPLIFISPNDPSINYFVTAKAKSKMEDPLIFDSFTYLSYKDSDFLASVC